MTTLDPVLARKMEPRASSPERRLDAIRRLGWRGRMSQDDFGASVTVCPHGLMPYEFLERAEEFYQAYRPSPRSPPSWPRYFMLCHSIEVALKA